MKVVINEKPKIGDMQMERKILPLEQKIDATARLVYGYAATYDEDSVDDRILPGAFTKTIKERFSSQLQAGYPSKIKMLAQHDTNQPLGKPVELREDAGGLYLCSKMAQTTLGNDYLQLCIEQIITNFSIGYLVKKF